jgi:7-cyano-7-deazaguanine synthase
LHVLALDYGQRQRRELLCARWQARKLGAKEFHLQRLRLSGLAKGSLVDAGAVRRRGLRGGKPSTYVNFRNGILLACAASFAEARGSSEVWGGWCRSDLGGYPDCSLPFFRAFERTVDAGTWAGRRGKTFKVCAPLARLDKAQTVAFGLRLGVDYSKTWTCYAPVQGKPCRRCDACRLRERGFRGAKFKDPLLGS